ncbi:hypothetical protein EDB84DRAFT_1511139 [Lactarius hengduanensis]|nr:hypothetical protein EDB84DRAFT_1511139 [Lactarius hengduanensis]
MTSTYPSSSRTTLFLRNYAQKKTPDIDVPSITRSVLLDNAEHVVSHEGTGQYSRNGSGAAACGLAALNFARVVFLKEQEGLRDAPLLQAVLSRECAEEITSVCAQWSGNLHLEVDEICRVPAFEKTLKLKTTTYGQPGVHHFKSLITDLVNLDSSAVVIITRPPEILACLKLRLSTRNVFIIFDSHPRPSYPNGAGAIVSTSVEGIARRLTELLPTVDLQDGILQWQAQLLSNCSGHVFVPHSLDMSTAALWQAVLESSLAQLSMQAEISDLRSQNDFQTSEQQRLESELKEVEERCRRQERTIQELRSSASNTHSYLTGIPQRHSSSSTSRSFNPSSSKTSTSAVNRYTATSHSTGSRSAGPHDTRGSPPALFGSEDKPSYAKHLQGKFDSEDRVPPVERTSGRYAATSSRSAGSRDPSPPPYFDRDDGLSYAKRLQSEFDSEDRALSAERTTLSRYPTSHSRSAGPRDTRGSQLPPHFEPDDGLSYAQRLQTKFDSEDRALSAERIKLSKNVQRVFQCGICMEDMPEDSVARPDPCGHAFCRECMHGYVSTLLKEHRFPILCPTCTAGKGKGKGVTGEVSQGLALNLGLTDEQFSIWTEMEMVAFSVLLHCRKCQRSMFVARDEHEEAKIIACPLPDCSHAWCKQCQQTIDFNGPKHSCDGTSELDHLMKQQGWKYCPSCKTPILKVSGCNHMSCMTPACNTHFCYLCGGLIVKSALGQEVKEATSNHFRSKCALFEYPGE